MFLLLLTALLYPGDKIIFQKDQVRPIRQPGGYYSDFKVFSPPLAMLNSLGFEETMAKKTNKLSVRPPIPSVLLLPSCCPFSYRSWDADTLGVSHCTNISVLTWHVQPGHHSLASPQCHPWHMSQSHSLLASIPHSHPPEHILYDLRLSGKD